MTHQIPPPHAHDHLTHPKYRPDIDGMRAVAILAVVIFHFFPDGLPGGFIGVDIFFVISGYLISTIIIGSLEKSSFSFIDFYKRRIRRIFPALLLILVATFGFGWFALTATEYKQVGKHVAAGAWFVSNFVYWDESGYFDNAAITKPLQHLWSLGIEEQFYIIWPLIIWGAWRLRKNLLGTALILLTVSFLLNIRQTEINAVADFYAPQTRFWELLIGSILAYLNLHGWTAKSAPANAGHVDSPSATTSTLSFLGMSLIGIGVWSINKNAMFPGWWALLPVTGTALVIAAGHRAWPNHIILTNRAMVWIGIISYPLYLWHWPLLSYSYIIEGTTPSISIRMLLLFTAIMLAWLTFRLVEQPIRRRSRSNVAVVTLFASVLVMGLVGYNCFSRDGLPFRKAEQVYSDNPAANKMLHEIDWLWPFRSNSACLKKYPLYTSKDDLKDWFCMENKDTSPTVILLGNSYANHLYPGLAENPELGQQSILSIGNCGATDATGLSPANNPKTRAICSGDGALKQQKLIDGIIRQSTTLRFAILAGLSPTPDESYIHRLKRRIDFLESQHLKVIVFVPHVQLDRDIRYCFNRPLRHAKNCEQSTEKREAITKNFAPVMRYLSQTDPNIKFFDPNDLFCDTEKCSALRDGLPLYRDASHLSEYGSIQLAKIFVGWAKKNVPEILAAPNDSASAHPTQVDSLASVTSSLAPEVRRDKMRANK